MCVLGRNEDILKKHFESLNLSDYLNGGPQRNGKSLQGAHGRRSKGTSQRGLTLEKGSHTSPITSQSTLQD